MKLLNRIALFLFLLGILLIGLFVLSDIAHMADLKLIFFGALSILASIVLQITNPAEPPPPSGRFGLFKKRRRKSKDG